jgi:hypothetical protein
MFRFTIRDVLWLTVVVAVVTFGCDRKTSRKIKAIRSGAEAVDQHANEVEQAAEANP